MGNMNIKLLLRWEKNILVFSISCLSLFFNKVEAAEFFGYRTYQKISRYLPMEVLQSKYDHTETSYGYYTVNFTQYLSRKEKSPYFDTYEMSIDRNHIIHEIVLRRDYYSLDTCKELKYSVIFSTYNETYPEFRSQSKEAILDDHRIAINCNYYFKDSSVEMCSFIATPEIDNAISEFYDKGF